MNNVVGVSGDLMLSKRVAQMVLECDDAGMYFDVHIVVSLAY